MERNNFLKLSAGEILEGNVLIVIFFSDEMDFGLIKAKTKRLIAFDAVDLATTAGSVMSVNIVLLGSLIQTGILPISKADVEETIRTKTKKAFVDVNLKAFELGYDTAASA